MVVSEWPSRSCRSRAIRLRSLSAARRASWARASASSRASRTPRLTTKVIKATTGMAIGVKLLMAELRLWCQEGTAAGTKMDASGQPGDDRCGPDAEISNTDHVEVKAQHERGSTGEGQLGNQQRGEETVKRPKAPRR